MKFCRFNVTLPSSVALCLFVISTTSSSDVLAQNGQPASTPKPAARITQALNPELDHILNNWEKAGDFTKKLEGKHKRYIYDHVFMVEKWSEGEFYYESPDKGRIDLEAPSNFTEGQKRARNGKEYAIQKDKPERWICDGKQVFAIDEDRKEYQRLPIPVDSQGENIVDGPLPFLFGISKEKVIARYNVTLHTAETGGRHNLEAGVIHLKVKPLWQQDAANWQQAEVMLDARSYLPTAIRLIHPGGNVETGGNNETVYVFENVTRNADQGIVGVLWKGDPFDPRLRGYKELTQTSMEPTSIK
ncbi:hypothetical protein [Rubinisphaera sp.]|uniref:hypothetical protein n=1 Tax=Rubinisphaera sp. TaxID=2024857 RepID=UPI000C112D75|nr:hypothetical protein [Rubinisphaera sp.]MBV09250.1 hypothetical protein [Rubinisphaera sp.]HCS50377.1 hypothetical protein [Planctomycetaceae bacterium]|tara:strand:- start:87 stop:992 length:906 start_codon:yes stop_codon:yes gene_type:complete